MGTKATDVKGIFGNAMDMLSSAQRAAYLDEVCGDNAQLRDEVESLLKASDEARGFFAGLSPCGVVTLDEPITERPGTVIGPYKLLEQIGEGGFGVVFMAEQQQPIRRKVALKVLKPGMDTKQVIARFEAERQALALMDHPNIAHVFDGGATDSGRPYFVMELVRGQSLTEYCDQNNLPIHERLELFVNVCQAVQHAHQKGIIHRDIKPSNILVTLHDGVPVPKVIDFGIAKATGPQLTDKTLFTNYAQMIGTPLYMSPEQAEMSGLDIDTRSDIYSLGVLMYELLTGTTPFDKERLRSAGYDEIRRIIREEEPCKPSTRMSTLNQAATTASSHRQSDPRKLSRLFRGELDWIVMKALEKDRNRRYESASVFAADVQHYLHDEPVQACPPSAAYRFRKFARRNKARLAIVGLVLAGLLLGVAMLVVNDLQITAAHKRTGEARDTADRQRAHAEENLKLALQALDQIYITPIEQEISDKRQHGKLPLAPDKLEQVDRQLLQKGLEFYEQFARANEDQASPLLRGEMGKAYQRVGYIHVILGQNDKAEQALAKGIDIVESLYREHPDLVDSYTLVHCYEWLGHVLMAKGRPGEAETVLRRYFAVTRQLAEAHPSDRNFSIPLYDASRRLLEALLQQGQFADAVELSEAMANRFEARILADDYNSACLHAVAAGTIRAHDKSEGAGARADAAANRAMACLHKAFADGAGLGYLRWDPDFDALRVRADFGKLMADLMQSPNMGPAILDAERGEWVRALAQYTQAFDTQPPGDPYAWFEYACLSAQCGGSAGYEKVCRRMRQQFGNSAYEDAVAVLAHAWLLAPIDPPVAFKLAERRLAMTQPPSGHYGWSVHLFGMANYRAGQNQQAVEWLNKGLQVEPDSRIPKGQLQVLGWLGLALAHDRLGHADEARSWFDKAQRWLKETTPKNLDKGSRFAPPGWPWRDWLLVQISYREAEEAMRKQTGAKEPTLK
jgi:serine/threonine protein kinase